MDEDTRKQSSHSCNLALLMYLVMMHRDHTESETNLNSNPEGMKDMKSFWTACL
jgi:hypothetical protein